MRIQISFSHGGKETTMTGELNQSPTARDLAAALPVQGQANTWGDELYWAIPVEGALEPGASDVREVGDLGYWPPGRAFCVFFGRTPASRGTEPRAASPVNLIGRLDLGPQTVADLRSVPSGAAVTIAAAGQG